MALIHILHEKNDNIQATLNSDIGEFFSAIRQDSISGENTLDVVINASSIKSQFVDNRKRLVIQNEDGDFNEYIVYYAEQNKRNEKVVRSDASFIDLIKAKVINPQTLTGTTPKLAGDFALSGTEWQIGIVDFTSTQTIVIDKYTNPYDFLKNIANIFDLDISFRITVSGNKISGRYVDLKSNKGSFRGKEIVFGKDLIGVKRTEDSSNIITSLFGYYKKQDGTVISTWESDDAAFQRWGRNGKHLVDFYTPDSSDDTMTLSQLQGYTRKELNKRLDSVVSYEGSAASIEHIFGREHERIRKGMTVRIKDDGYNPPLYLEARIDEVQIDQITGKILNYKLGNFIEFNKSDLEAQIADLTDKFKDQLKNMISAQIASSAGNVFKNSVGSKTLTAKAFLSATELDSLGTLYTYSWIKKDMSGNTIAGYSKTTKNITVTPTDLVSNVATFICTITTNLGVTLTADYSVTNINDGSSTYSWVKYADDANGTNMSDDPTGKRYLGLAVNKTTSTESTIATDYTWSPLYDNVQVGARNLYLDSYLKRVLSYSSVSTLTRTDKSTVTGTETNLIKLEHNGVAGDSPNFGFRHATSDQSIKFESGKKYTLSFKARGNVTNFSYTYFMRASAEGSNSGTGSNPVTLDTTNWTDVVIYKDGPFDSLTGYILIGSADGGSGKWFEVKEVKLEQGNIKTYFTQAQEEITPITAVLSNEVQAIPTDSAGNNGVFCRCIFYNVCL
jgi:phage minor structural protein